MPDYGETMMIGQARYQDVLDDLATAGLPASFTQTGGMCAALEVTLDSGHTLLITDQNETLAWDREEHHGWAVGLYPPDDADTDGECLTFDSTADGAATALRPLIDTVLTVYLERRRGGERRSSPAPARKRGGS